MRIPIKMLGQSGVRMVIDSIVIYIDPYLSHSVEELDAKDLKRLTPIAIRPEDITDADWVFITHEHIDHCDPHTLPKLAKSSSNAKFLGPLGVIQILSEWGIEKSRLHVVSKDWRLISDMVEVKATIAAHPTIECFEDGQWKYIGFLIKTNEGVIYIAGDTSVCDELIDYLQNENIHTAFLPVNEINYFRNKRGVIGNMSVREAFELASEIGCKQVVAVHWDMFNINSVYPEEIRLIHEKMAYQFHLLINPTSISLKKPAISIILRTLNEERHLEQLLLGIEEQKLDKLDIEVVLIDSGSTDNTLNIAKKHNCHILHITREEFSFGRSLNRACRAAAGDILVITSGHCVPVNEHWLQNLCQPILDGVAQYTYGKQLGGEQTQFSEVQVFEKYFTNQSKIPQEGFYCNNANSALLRSVWEKYHFDETLTGLEDSALAKQIVINGGKVAYVANAIVYHYHYESWKQIRRRFEREAIALQKIMPEVHVGILDTARYILSSVCADLLKAKQEGVVLTQAKNIVLYRYNQYIGGYKGNHQHRQLSHQQKEKYFYPK